MRTLGIDLSSNPKRTGAALVEWASGRGTLAQCCPAAENDDLARLAEGCDVVAIDAPLGWPRAFVAAVSGHQRGEPWRADPGDPGLRLRATDQHVGEGRIWPLSVSTDRIGIVAFRAAHLLPLLSKVPSPARDGSDGIIEVYPAAALRRWGMRHNQYKRAEERHWAARKTILDLLREKWIDVVDHEQTLLDSADALDALICAVIAFEFKRGGTDPIPDDLQELAREEGWIHLPKQSSPPPSPEL